MYCCKCGGQLSEWPEQWKDKRDNSVDVIADFAKLMEEFAGHYGLSLEDLQNLSKQVLVSPKGN
jgi:predicted Zn-dependent protease with MMP-like domain